MILKYKMDLTGVLREITTGSQNAYTYILHKWTEIYQVLPALDSKK